MKPTTIPAICSLVLTATLAAGVSHWWSVREFADMMQHGIPVAPAPAAAPGPMLGESPALLASSQLNKTGQAQMTQIKQPGSKGEHEFFAALVEKMNRVEAQNRDLLDQLAETNRDMMKLEFRVDTHSESFRPLPLIEEKPFSSIDQNIGVLPPKAQPISLPSYD